MNNSDRQSAIAQILNLMQEFDLTLDELKHASADVVGDASSRSTMLVKVLSYIGGAFIISGIAAFIATQWGDMNSAARVVITLGSGLALFVIAITALADDRYTIAAIPLLLGAAALEPIGMLVALNEFGSGSDAQVAACATAAAVAIQFALAFFRYRRTTMALVTVFFGSAFLGLLLDLAGVDWSVIALSMGSAWLLLGLQVHSNTHRAIGPPLFFFGCWASLLGLFELLEGTTFEILFMGAACGMTYLGIWAHSRALNFASTVAILAYTAYFTAEHFAGSVGWPIALTLLGMLMLAIGALALRIDRKYLRGRDRSHGMT